MSKKFKLNCDRLVLTVKVGDTIQTVVLPTPQQVEFEADVATVEGGEYFTAACSGVALTALASSPDPLSENSTEGDIAENQ